MDVYNQREIKSERERIRLSVMDKHFNVYYYLGMIKIRNTLEWENKKNK